MKFSIVEKAGRSIARNWAGCMSHALFFGGLAAAVYGAFLIYHPAGVIVAGGIAVWIARLMEQEQRESR